MRFDVELSDRATDLVDEGFDAAVRIGAIGSQNLVGRKIGETQARVLRVARVSGQHGEPKTPEDLAAHACMTYEYSLLKNVWPFRDPEGHDRSIKVAGPVHANYGRFLTALAVAGAAIVLEPDFLVGPEVRAGRLVPILRRFESPPGNIYVVYPSRRNLSAKVRAFADFLSARFAAPDWAMETPAPLPTRAVPRRKLRAS